MTIFQIADDVANALGFTTDDRLINRVAIAYNVKIAIDKIRDQIIQKAYSSDIRQVQDMLETFEVDVEDHVADSEIPWNCMFFDLPVELYSLPYDGGLAWVRYHRNSLPRHCTPQIARTSFNHYSLGELSNVYASEYERPNGARPGVARDKYRVYVFGVDPQITKLHVGLFAALPNFTDLDPNEEVSLPSEYLLAVKKLVLDTTRFSLQLPERYKNDGRDLEPGQPIRTERQVSLNDPLNLEQT